MGSSGRYRDKLQDKASEFINRLKSRGLDAEIAEESFREYSVKISLEGNGVINLFYAPTKDEYKLTVNEIYQKSVADEILKLWNPGYRDAGSVYTEKGIEIDVDGSYMNGITSYGAVIRRNGKMIGKLSGILDESEVEGSHQVAGEIKAVKESVEWCVRNNIGKATFYYDYTGLEKWAKGAWKTKKNLTSGYGNYMKNIPVSIKWVKIESHTGAEWNEYADRLAKEKIMQMEKKGKQKH